MSFWFLLVAVPFPLSFVLTLPLLLPSSFFVPAGVVGLEAGVVAAIGMICLAVAIVEFSGRE